MKTLLNYSIALIVGITSTIQINAQTSEFLDINNVKARINANNYLFNDPAGVSIGYEYPINSGKGTIFSANLIMLGEDSNSLIKGIVPQINGSTDLYAGPIMDTQYYATSAQIWDRVWKINCSTIQTFKDWWQAGVDDAANGTTTQITNFPGYIIPQSILGWPAHGDVSKGQLWFIAPFFDNDGDNFYDPNAGDYPLIKGDQAIFFVYNDERPSWSIASNRIEVRVMAYAFGNAQDSALNNTTFLHYEIINRSSIALNNVQVGLNTDFDIGGYADDFMGSDVARSSFYGYNGDAFDADISGLLGYGSNLAAQSVVFLSGPGLDNDFIDNPSTPFVQNAIDSNGTVYPCIGQGFGDGIIDNEYFGLENFLQYGGSSGPQSTPSTGADYYNYLRSIWKDGSIMVSGGNGHVSGGGTDTANYIYPGNSDPLFYGTGGVIPAAPNWSEIGEGNPPGDRKGIGSFGSFTLEPGEINRVDIALVSGIDYTGSGIQASLNVMNERVDSIRTYFCAGLISSCEFGNLTTAIETHSLGENILTVFPNPFTNQFSVNYEAENNTATLAIYNVIGEQIMNQTITQKTTSVDLAKQANGIYFVVITDGNNRISQKIIKQ